MDEKSTLLKLGSLLRARRTELGYSQESFADYIGMHRAYYSSIERGARNITVMTLLRVTNGLDIKVATLFKGL